MAGIASQSLFKSSWQILRADRRIFRTQLKGLFVISALSIALIGGVFLLGDTQTTGDTEYVFELTPLAVIFSAFMYLVITFASVVIQALILTYALARFRKQQITKTQAWGRVKQKMFGLFKFSLLAATVGFVLGLIDEKLPLAGKIATWLVGAAWAIASMFSVAVIIDKNETNPIKATKKSAAIFKDTFGANVTVNLGLGLVTALGILLLAIPGVLVTIAMFGLSQVAGFISVILFTLALLVLVVVASSLAAIIKAGLYEYSVSGKTPDEFNEQVFRAAITEKQARKTFSWS